MARARRIRADASAAGHGKQTVVSGVSVRPGRSLPRGWRCTDPGGNMAPMPRLLRTFYGRSALVVARELLGKVLVHKVAGGERSGVIVETEAYLGERDLASH